MPPGLTIRDTMEHLGISGGKLARALGLSEGEVASLLEGSLALTDDIARGLEATLGVPASLWSNLERQYRELQSAPRPKAPAEASASF